MVDAFKTTRKYFFSRRTPAKVYGNLKSGGMNISEIQGSSPTLTSKLETLSQYFPNL